MSAFFGAGSAGSAEFVVFANVLIALIVPKSLNPVPKMQESLRKLTGLRA